MKNIFLKIGILLGVSTLLVLPFIVVANGTEKITICHATGSEKNPYVEITISVKGLNGHLYHEGDVIPVPPEGCSVLSPPAPQIAR